MKKLLVVAAAVAVIFGVASCGVGGGRITNDIDTMSYAYGVFVGNSIKSQDSTVNANLFAKGFIDAFAGKALTADSARMLLDDYYMVKFPAKKQKEETAYLESLEKGNPNIKKTESGLFYEIIMPGDESIKAADGDQVVVNYTGRLREGVAYDATKEGKQFDKNDSITFDVTRVVPGFSEGLKLVGKGGKIRLWIPSAIGYGPQGQQGMGPIGPYETLFFDVDLLDVIPAAPVAGDTTVPAAN